MRRRVVVNRKCSRLGRIDPVLLSNACKSVEHKGLTFVKSACLFGRAASESLRKAQNVGNA